MQLSTKQRPIKYAEVPLFVVNISYKLLLSSINKVKYVIVPKMNERKIEELYNWDLWGPLLFCFLYSIALSTGKNNSESSIFVLVFFIFWVGGFAITFNERFLGAQIGVCQVLSLLGYGMFPTTVAGIIIGFGGITNIIVKLIISTFSIIILRIN